MSYTSVKGMDDLCPPESYRWAEIEKKAKAGNILKERNTNLSGLGIPANHAADHN